MYPHQNDVIRRYTEQVILFILFLATKTDHRVTRKWKLLSFSDLLLFMQIMRSEPENFANFDILWRQCDFIKHLLLL